MPTTLLTSLLALAAIAPGLAQATGGITGRVTNIRLAPVAGATVELVNEANGGKSGGRLQTAADGVYTFTNIPVGVYTVVVTLPGSKGATRTGVEVSRGDRVGLADIVLEIEGVTDPAPPDREAQELDIREATFRYQFTRNHSSLQARAASYYLAIAAEDGQRTDPPEALMRRFGGQTPVVRKWSDCVISNGPVIDRQTGQRGLIFNTGRIIWMSETEVAVSGGYFEGSASASGNTYYLTKIDGRWVVLRDVMHWIA